MHCRELEAENHILLSKECHNRNLLVQIKHRVIIQLYYMVKLQICCTCLQMSEEKGWNAGFTEVNRDIFISWYCLEIYSSSRYRKSMLETEQFQICFEWSWWTDIKEKFLTSKSYVLINSQCTMKEVKTPQHLQNLHSHSQWFKELHLPRMNIFLLLSFAFWQYLHFGETINCFRSKKNFLNKILVH